LPNGDVASNEQRPSIGRGCARAVLRTYACALTLVLAASALSSKHALTWRTKRAIVEQARLCAAALEPGPNGELWTSVDRLRSQYGALAAVATLGASGDLQTLYPSDKSYLSVARATLEAGGNPVRSTIRSRGKSQDIWAVIVPLNGSDSPSAARVAMMFTQDGQNDIWLTSTVTIGVVLVVGLVLAFVYITRWFDHDVVRPLRLLSQRQRLRNLRGDEQAKHDVGVWRETEEIANAYRSVSEEIIRIHQQMESQLRARTRGFDLQLRRAQDRAMTDCLTGLWNRAFLEAELPVLYSRQCAESQDFCIIMIDVDNFKRHNDTHGHKAGDDVLRFLGGLLRASIRATDYAVRYGGDEFLLLLPGVGIDPAEEVATRIVTLFRQYAATIAGGRHLSLSAGVVSRKMMGCESGYALISKADTALYATKRKGKNAVTVASCD